MQAMGTGPWISRAIFEGRGGRLTALTALRLSSGMDLERPL